MEMHIWHWIGLLWGGWGVVLSCALVLQPADLNQFNREFYEEARALYEAAPEMKETPDEITPEGISIFTRDPLDLGLVDIPDIWVRHAAQEYIQPKIDELKLQQPEVLNVPSPSPIRVARLARAQDKRTARAWKSLVKKRGLTRKKSLQKRRTNNRSKKSKRVRRYARRKNLGAKHAKRRAVPKRKEKDLGYSPTLKKALQIASR